MDYEYVCGVDERTRPSGCYLFVDLTTNVIKNIKILLLKLSIVVRDYSIIEEALSEIVSNVN